VLELTSKVSQRYAISVPDDAVAELTTPGRAVQRVNDWLAGV
jgi:acyl carrier protein